MKFPFADRFEVDRMNSVPFAGVAGFLICTTLSVDAMSDDGKVTYEQYCAMCHTNTDNGIPKHCLIASYSQERILDALINGAMQDQAYDMSREEIAMAANYLKSIDVQQECEGKKTSTSHQPQSQPEK